MRYQNEAREAGRRVRLKGPPPWCARICGFPQRGRIDPGGRVHGTTGRSTRRRFCHLAAPGARRHVRDDQTLSARVGPLADEAWIGTAGDHRCGRPLDRSGSRRGPLPIVSPHDDNSLAHIPAFHDRRGVVCSIAASCGPVRGATQAFDRPKDDPGFDHRRDRRVLRHKHSG